MADAFQGIPKIEYEGPDSKNPLAFKHYNPDFPDEYRSSCIMRHRLAA